MRESSSMPGGGLLSTDSYESRSVGGASVPLAPAGSDQSAHMHFFVNEKAKAARGDSQSLAFVVRYFFRFLFWSLKAASIDTRTQASVCMVSQTPGD